MLSGSLISMLGGSVVTWNSATTVLVALSDRDIMLAASSLWGNLLKLKLFELGRGVVLDVVLDVVVRDVRVLGLLGNCRVY